MHKKTIVLTASITALLSINIAIAGGFTDVRESHPNVDAIGFVQSANIVSGYPDGTFKPDNKINRAEFTKIIMETEYKDEVENAVTCLSDYKQGLKLCGPEDGECGIPVWEMFAECMYGTTGDNIEMSQWDKLTDYEECFPDVKDEDWFRKYVCYAKFKDFIEGYPDGTFKPAKTINFVEAAKIIVETFKYTYENSGNTGDNWYQPYVGMLGDLKVIPVTITSFDKEITRGEMAEIIYRLKDTSLDLNNMEYVTYAEIKNGADKVQNEYEAYKKWMIPSPPALEEQEDKTDCVGVENGMLEGGDLLSTLIADEDARSRLHLNVYTQDYMHDLEKRVVTFTHSLYESDFYAMKVCHLDQDLDVVAGKLWPMGESTTEVSEKIGSMEKQEFTSKETVVLIVSKNQIIKYDNVKVVDNTATGAESQTCKANLQDDYVLWECFMGLHFVDENSIDGAEMKYWKLPLSGANDVEIWESIK